MRKPTLVAIGVYSGAVVEKRDDPIDSRSLFGIKKRRTFDLDAPLGGVGGFVIHARNERSIVISRRCLEKREKLVDLQCELRL